MAMNKSFVSTVVSGVIALILMLSAFIVPQWQNRLFTSPTATNGDVQTLRYLVGMTTWVYEDKTVDSNAAVTSYTHVEGTLATDGSYELTTSVGGPTTTIVPPASTTFYQNAGVVAIISDSITARNGLLGSGVPAFILGVIFLGMLAFRHTAKVAWFMPVCVFLCVLTAVLTFVGVFLYAKVLNIGYSFIIWAGFAIFALLGGIFTIIPSVGSKGRFVPIVCMLVALALGIVALSTPNWYSEVNDNRPTGDVTSANAGVKAYSLVYEAYQNDVLDSTTTYDSSFGSDKFTVTYVPVGGGSTVLPLTKCPDTPSVSSCYIAVQYEKSIFKDFISGGEKVLGCGIPALLFGAAAAVMMGMTLSGATVPHGKPAIITCAFVGSGLAFLGLFLYAAVTSVGASFVIYAAAGFMWVLASCQAFGLLNGTGSAGSTSTSAKKEAKKEPPASTSTSASTDA